jgi:predicted RNA-binding Zn ribbon-like protein
MDSKYNAETGWLCLDFANTVEWHASSQPVESILNYSDLLEWSRQAGIVSDIAADSLKRQGEGEKAEARSILNKARELREAIYHILSDTIHQQPAKSTDMDVFNRAVADMLSHSKLISHNTGFTWECDYETDRLDSILWPVIRSAVDLMTSEALERVGQCADEQGCGWLFWDSSRNRSRRWCDMRDCGNRAKVRRYYDKSRSNDTSQR